MRLSFSTRGWKDISFDKFLDIAEEMDYSGVEVYKLIGDKDLFVKGEAFNQYNIAATTRQLRDRKLAIPVFDGTYDLTNPEEIEDLQDMVKAAFNAAVDNLDEISDAEMQKLTGGVSFPGLF